MNPELSPEQRKLAAQQYSEALAVELRKPEPLPALFSLLANVEELRSYREQAVEEGAPPDELAAIDKSIDEILSAEVVGRKADGIAGTLHSWEDLAAQAKRAEEVAARHRKHWESRIEWLKDRTLNAMQTHGVTKIETAANRIRVQKNGSLAPLEVNPEAIPLEYIRATVTMSRVDLDGLPTVYADKMKYVSQEPDNARIRAALAQRVPCPECKGTGETYQGQTEGFIGQCPRCEGKRTIANNVIGARLLDRASHLRVE